MSSFPCLVRFVSGSGQGGYREGPGAGDRGRCVRVPGASAGGPDGGAAGGPGVGAVGADDRPPPVVGVGPVCLPGGAGGYAGAGQPGAAWPDDPPPGRDDAITYGPAGAGAADPAEDLVSGGSRPAAGRDGGQGRPSPDRAGGEPVL